MVDGTTVSKASHGGTRASSGTFGAFRAPKVVGVSDEVAQSTKILARRASREMAAWKRTLPKGVKI